MSLENLFIFRTGMSKNMAMAESIGLGRHISKQTAKDDILALPRSTIAYEAWKDKNPYSNPETMPIVCLINGFGTSGKDSFIRDINGIVCDSGDFVAISISPIYPAIEDAAACLQRELYKYNSTFIDTAKTDYDDLGKSSEWRTLCHEIKNAWHKVGDGPNKYIVARVIDAIEKRTDNDPAPFIFVHTRESENLNILRETFWGLGLRAISVLIDGRIEYSNQPEDKTVMDFNYDVVIDNSGSAYLLEEKAYSFALGAFEWIHKETSQ